MAGMHDPIQLIEFTRFTVTVANGGLIGLKVFDKKNIGCILFQI